MNSISSYQKSEKLFSTCFWGLLILNLLQAGFSGLLDDEAYYWMYSRFLDWGYYDHPPMIALSIKAGYTLFQSVFGLRLMSVLMVSSCVWMMYKMQQPVNNSRLMAIVLSMGLIHFGAFMAVPDIPLVFFTTLFLFAYHSFLKKETWAGALLLSITMAGMLYSKYHGLLVILFTVLANLRLLRSPKFWVAAIIGAALFVPHLLWQNQHGWPSLQYHLVERSSSTYKFNYSTDYLLGQLFMFGPLIGWMVFYAAFKQKTKGNVWIRTLKWNVLGIVIFFLLSTLKGRVEPNWTVMALIPSILLLHYYLDSAPRLNKVLYKLLPFSLLLIFVVRAAFVWDFLGDKVAKNKEIHDSRVWTSWVKEKANGYPVYFINSYQLPSKYTFFEHQPATCYSTVGARNNQYDIWNLDKTWTQDSVLVVTNDAKIISKDSIITNSSGKIFCEMFANPNLSKDSSFQERIPERKKLVPFKF